MRQLKRAIIAFSIVSLAGCCTKLGKSPDPPESLQNKQNIERKSVLLRRPMGAMGDFLVVLDEQAWYPLIGQPFTPGRSVRWSYLVSHATTQPDEPDEVHASEMGCEGFVGDGEPAGNHLVNAWLLANNVVVVVLEDKSSGAYFAMVIGYGTTAATQADLMTDPAAPNLSADISGAPASKDLTITLSGPNALRRFVYNDWDQKWHEIHSR